MRNRNYTYTEATLLQRKAQRYRKRDELRRFVLAFARAFRAELFERETQRYRESSALRIAERELRAFYARFGA